MHSIDFERDHQVLFAHLAKCRLNLHIPNVHIVNILIIYINLMSYNVLCLFSYLYFHVQILLSPLFETPATFAKRCFYGLPF